MVLLRRMAKRRNRRRHLQCTLLQLPGKHPPQNTRQTTRRIARTTLHRSPQTKTRQIETQNRRRNPRRSTLRLAMRQRRLRRNQRTNQGNRSTTRTNLRPTSRPPTRRTQHRNSSPSRPRRPSRKHLRLLPQPSIHSRTRPKRTNTGSPQRHPRHHRPNSQTRRTNPSHSNTRKPRRKPQKRQSLHNSKRQRRRLSLRTSSRNHRSNRINRQRRLQTRRIRNHSINPRIRPNNRIHPRPHTQTQKRCSTHTMGLVERTRHGKSHPSTSRRKHPHLRTLPPPQHQRTRRPTPTHRPIPNQSRRILGKRPRNNNSRRNPQPHRQPRRMGRTQHPQMTTPTEKTQSILDHAWETAKPKHGTATLVEILWIDAASLGASSWEDPDTTQDIKPPKALTIGYLWEKTDTYIKVIASLTGQQHGNGIVIPIGCIHQIRTIRK